MSLKLISFTSIIILILNLSGCGFHLRGTQNYVLPFDTVMIAPDDPFDPVYKQLRHSLQAKKIKVISKNIESMANANYCTNIPKIIILNHTLTERPFAYGPDGEIRRETLTLEMEYQYEYYIHNHKKIKIHTITARRFRQLNLNQNLADMAEKVIIEKEMILDVVQQLLVQLTV